MGITPYFIYFWWSFNYQKSNYKDNLDNSKKFLSDLGNPYDAVLVDSDGTKSIELGAIGVPETYLINNENKIIKKFIGPLDQDDYEDIISLIKK